MMSNNENLYSTTDFYTTAVLISQNFEVVNLTSEPPSNKVKRFHFKDSPELRKTIMAYTNKTLDGNIRDFKEAIETVKEMVHSC